MSQKKNKISNKKTVDGNDDSKYYRLDQSEIEKIRLILEKSDGRYHNQDSFIREAIDLMCLFWNNPGPELNIRMKNLWKNLPDSTKNYVSLNSPKFYSEMESTGIIEKNLVDSAKTNSSGSKLKSNTSEKISPQNSVMKVIEMNI